MFDFHNVTINGIEYNVAEKGDYVLFRVPYSGKDRWEIRLNNERICYGIAEDWYASIEEMKAAYWAHRLSIPLRSWSKPDFGPLDSEEDVEKERVNQVNSITANMCRDLKDLARTFGDNVDSISDETWTEVLNEVAAALETAMSKRK